MKLLEPSESQTMKPPFYRYLTEKQKDEQHDQTKTIIFYFPFQLQAHYRFMKDKHNVKSVILDRRA
jgi:hypothetical protein